jgi:hypothetical protein
VVSGDGSAGLSDLLIAAIADDTEDIGAYLADVGDHLWRAFDDTEANREALPTQRDRTRTEK